MTSSNEIATQPSLSPEVFGRFINLKVAMNLAGSASYDLAELEKVMAGEQLQKGSELVVTARYFIADMTMPVSRRGGYGNSGDTYELGNAKLALKLIEVKSIDVKEGQLHQCQVMKCACLVENVPNTEKPDGHKAAAAPLSAFWAKSDCPDCGGKGYVHPRKNKAPLAQRIWSHGGVLVLVDEFPEPPDAPDDSCPQCGEIRWHVQDCPVKAEEEAAAKKAKQEAKDIYKAETGKAAPKCYGDYNEYRGDCRSCEAAEACARFGGVEYAEPQTTDEKPECFGRMNDGLGPDDCSNCDFGDECVEVSEASEDGPEEDQDTDE